MLPIVQIVDSLLIESNLKGNPLRVCGKADLGNRYEQKDEYGSFQEYHK
jgi:hypothetical protein